MGTTFERPRARYDAQRIVDDAGAKGWMLSDLAREAGLSVKTVTLFVRNEIQTPKTAKKLARALGRSPAAYLIREAVSA